MWARTTGLLIYVIVLWQRVVPPDDYRRRTYFWKVIVFIFEIWSINFGRICSKIKTSMNICWIIMAVGKKTLAVTTLLYVFREDHQKPCENVCALVTESRSVCAVGVCTFLESFLLWSRVYINAMPSQVQIESKNQFKRTDLQICLSLRFFFYLIHQYA